MDDQIRKYLQDILAAVEETQGYFVGEPLLFERFQNNLMLRRAVERNVEIMGEAMNRILKIEKDIKITDARRIVDARNYIVHGYDRLSPDILWSIVVNHLSILKTEVLRLLSEY